MHAASRCDPFAARRPGRDRMIPGWLPDGAVAYLAHTAAGLPLRALARARGCHASTVLRQIRRVEAWRDDPLIDEALERMSRLHAAECRPIRRCQGVAVDADPGRPARRWLRSAHRARGAAHPAPALREGGVPRGRRRAWRRRWCCARWCPGKQNRIAVVDRDMAHAFALQEWISCEKAGKIACYTITRGGAGGAEAAADRGARRPGAAYRLRGGAGAVPGAAPLLRRADGDGRGRLGRAASCASTSPRARSRCSGASATRAGPPT